MDLAHNVGNQMDNTHKIRRARRRKRIPLRIPLFFLKKQMEAFFNTHTIRRARRAEIEACVSCSCLCEKRYAFHAHVFAKMRNRGMLNLYATYMLLTKTSMAPHA